MAVKHNDVTSCIQFAHLLGSKISFEYFCYNYWKNHFEMIFLN